MCTAEMRHRVAAARVARLATLGSAGAPQQVPFCFVLEAGGDTLYSAVDDKPKRTPRLQRMRNAARDPRVSVLVDHYEDDWSRLWWARLDGRVRELAAGAEAERALDLLAGKYPQYREHRPAGPVLRVDVDRWTCWEAAPA